MFGVELCRRGGLLWSRSNSSLMAIRVVAFMLGEGVTVILERCRVVSAEQAGGFFWSRHALLVL